MDYYYLLMSPQVPEKLHARNYRSADQCSILRLYIRSIDRVTRSNSMQIEMKIPSTDQIFDLEIVIRSRDSNSI